MKAVAIAVFCMLCALKTASASEDCDVGDNSYSDFYNQLDLKNTICAVKVMYSITQRDDFGSSTSQESGMFLLSVAMFMNTIDGPRSAIFFHDKFIEEYIINADHPEPLNTIFQIQYADFLIDADEFAEGLEKFREYSTVFESGDERYDSLFADVMHSVVVAEAALNRPNAFSRSSDVLLEISKKVFPDNPSELARVNLSIARGHRLLGNNAEAIKHLTLAERIIQEHQVASKYRSDVIFEIIDIHLSGGNVDLARDAFHRHTPSDSSSMFEHGVHMIFSAGFCLHDGRKESAALKIEQAEAMVGSFLVRGQQRYKEYFSILQKF